MTAENLTLQPLELWAGVECTVNRVGDAYLDQLKLSGHHLRVEDLGRVAALGVRVIRYPVLWERTANVPESRVLGAGAAVGRLPEDGAAGRALDCDSGEGRRIAASPGEATVLQFP